MKGRRLDVVFFDAMGTVVTLRPWVTVMINEFTGLSETYNVKFEDVSSAWSTEWRRVNQEVRSEEKRPFQSVRDLFYEAFSCLGKKIGVQLEESRIRATIERVYSYVNIHAAAYPDVSDTLEALRSDGYEIGVISDADHEDLTLQLKSAGILKFFDMITTSSEALSYKPNPRIFEIALGKMGCGSRQSCHVGDTQEFDILGANNMGIHSILVTHGKTKVDSRLSPPTHVIKEIGEVIPLVRGLASPSTE